MMKKQLCILLLAAAPLLFAGCSSDDSPTSPDENGRVVKANPSFSSDIQEIFNRRGCTGGTCHGSATQAGLDLRSGAAYGDLVNVPSTQGSLDRVEPNDADNSYLMIKIEGTQTVGGRMPLNAAPLDSIDMANIRNWINAGAADN